MSDSPLIAVVMPAYNQARFVAKAIQSVLSQTYENWFLSICDDGSTDDSAAIIAPYAVTNPKVSFTRHPVNLGLCSARNSAYAQIPLDAEFVVFLDSDDLLETTALEAQLARFEVGTLAGIVAGDMRNIGACGCPRPGKYRTAPLTPGRIYTFEDVAGGDMTLFPPSRLMFRRWVTDVAGGWDVGIKAVEDHDFYLRCTLHAPLIYTPGTVTAYRNHDGNGTDDRQAMVDSWPLRNRLRESYRMAKSARGQTCR